MTSRLLPASPRRGKASGGQEDVHLVAFQGNVPASDDKSSHHLQRSARILWDSHGDCRAALGKAAPLTDPVVSATGALIA